MSKSIRLQVPKPCHESWENMTEMDRGRFCSSCQKKVVDFSLMNDHQVLEYISKTKSGLCGHFSVDQLNRNISTQKKTKLIWYKYLLHVMIPALLMTNKSSGQTKITGDTITCTQQNINPNSMDGRLTGKLATSASQEKEFAITGRVIDEKNNPIEGATVFIKGSRKGVASDGNGFFLLTVNKTEMVTLVFSSVGYIQIEKKIDVSKEENTNTVVMKMSPSLAGEVVVVGYITVAKKVDTTIFQKIKNRIAEFCIPVKVIKPDTVTVFPNPVQSGSMINIEFNLNHASEYVLMVSNISGQPVLHKKLTIDEGKHIERLSSENFAHGIYIVQAIDLSAKKTYDNKILVL